MNFIEEVKWRGMLHQIMPGTEEILKEKNIAAYVGIDPTADSLHIGHLVGVMLLRHFQRAGHQPIALVGGATGMIGDPSGKSAERNLLTIETIRHNQEKIKTQLAKFLDFSEEKENKALMVNNYDWMSKFSFLDFIRDVGKHISVNYMFAKDSVKKRMTAADDKDAEGLSFTEFSYQLVQGYDFLYLYKEYNCKLQMGGSDQWGNITTGTELIRRMLQGKAFALTSPLITKADGGKFGKTEKGNIWLDPEKTSPYEFYQFWINTSDGDAEKYLKIFTVLTETEIETLVKEHNNAPHIRLLQKKLAEELTIMVHSKSAYDTAVAASQILFGKGSKESLQALDEKTFNDIFSGVPHYKIKKQILEKGINIIDLLAEKTSVFKSKGEIRRLIKDNGLSINMEKFKDADELITSEYCLNNKYIVIRQGKKKYSIIITE
ncbi:MAG: tyrosine--tRNA ligase [Bacteroidales bacterium]|nr:tyrosine--tRNA ligase [Bacteroidales bacterium]